MKTPKALAAHVSKTTSLLLLLPAIILLSSLGLAQTGGLKTIKLNDPDKKRGLPFMEALSVKASAVDWSEKELSLQDLSDLLWAANGMNRPAEKKYTASSAMNAHDVDLYLFTKDGVFVYDADNHVLQQVLDGDFRSQIVVSPPSRPTTNPPVQIILISETARFKHGSPELKREWAAIDAGIVSQNISLFCAATGLKTRPKASMDRENIKKLLNLKDTQYVLLDHPVGYAK